MQIKGITWHGSFSSSTSSPRRRSCAARFLGLTPMVEEDGWTLFPMPNGTMLDLFEPDSQMTPTYDLNDGIVFGFRVDDIEAAAAGLKASGLELLCDIHRIAEMSYAYCHFRGPDGRVYGINEQK
jgi:hypothetical protein